MQRLTVSGSVGPLLIPFMVLASSTGSLAQGSLVGMVLSTPGDKPLANAEILILDLNRTARSDSAGAFRLTGLPPGNHQIFVRLTGYEPWKGTLTFRDSVPIEVDFVLRVLPTLLPGVDVKAAPDLTRSRLADFEERRRSGFGRFIAADVFERETGRNLSDIILSRIPGLKAIGGTNDRVMSSTRAGTRRCLVQVVVNGTAVFTGQPGQQPFHIDGVLPEDVLGMEFYTLATTPARYMGTGGPANNDGSPQGPVCGTLILWVK